MSINLKKYLPKILRTDFWLDLMDAVETELSNIQNELIIPKKDYWNSSIEDENQLIEIAKTLGYTPDRSLDSSIDYLRHDVESINYRIKKKSTKLTYYHIFRFMEKLGEIYVSFWDGAKLNRMYQNLNTIETHNIIETYFLDPYFDLVTFILDDISLDLGDVLYLDNEWTLDSNISSVSNIFSKHLFIEYLLNEIIENEYLITPSYMNYLFRAVDYTRRLTTVPHVGCQITALMDNSGEYDKGFFKEEYYSSAIFGQTTNVFVNPRMEIVDNWSSTNSGILESEKNYPDGLPFKYNQDSVIKLTVPDGQTDTSIYQTVTIIADYDYTTQFWVYIPDSMTGDVKLSNYYDNSGVWALINEKIITDRNKWTLVDLPFHSNNTTQTHYISIDIINGNQGDLNDYIYVCRGQLEALPYKTPWTLDTRVPIIPSFAYTMQDKFILDLQVESWFNYDTLWNRVIFTWKIDSTHILSLYYQATTDTFLLQWYNGTNNAIIESMQFDDGTSFVNINQKLRFIFSIDLTTGNTTGSRMIIITEDGNIYEFNTWSLDIDAYTTGFDTLSLGYNFNISNFYLDGIISYFKIYQDIFNDPVNSVEDIENILSNKTLDKQLNLTTYDNYQYEVYSIPDIKLNATIIPDNYNVDPVPTTIEIGSGKFRFENQYVTNTGYFYPTELVNKIASKELKDNDNDATTNWDFYKSFFQANTIESEILATGDGTTINFSGTLKYSPLEPKTLKISYYSFPEQYEVIDNGDGTLSGDRAYGTINYLTGEYSLITKKDILITNELIATGSQTSIDYYLQHLEEGLIPGTITLDYWITTTSTVHYRTTDDGNGNFPAINGISSGTINYATGEIQVTFENATDPNYNITVDYQYTDETPPDNATNIVATYYNVTEDIIINEMGLKNVNGDLIAYATFPPILLGDKRYHLSTQFFINRYGF